MRLESRLISAEQILCLLEETLADGIHVLVARFGELLQPGFLRVGQLRGHFDIDADMQIAAAVALKIFYAFAAQSEHRVGLCTSGDFDRGLVGERGHLHFRTQRGLDETHGHFAKQIVAVALENFVRLEMQHHVEIARWSAAQSALAIAGGAQSRTGIHSRRDAERDF